jgi:4-amino-4-deoxy-L-arabinose transferase-like glycosyltransferase
MTDFRSALAGAALLALIGGALFFSSLGAHPLLDPDEGRHAEVAREMAEARGIRRLYLPTLDFRPYREKPPAYYWLVTVAFDLLGPGEAGARLPSAVAAFVTVLALYAYAAPRFGVAGALGAGLAAATSLGWFTLARYGNLDMTLTACVALGVLAGLAWLDRPAPRRRLLLPYVLAALGTLVKGPLAIALVAGPLALALLVHRPRPALAELGLGRGLLVAVGILLVLYGPVALLDPSYLGAFATTNLRRWTADAPHAAPVYYYVLWLPVLLLPWTVFAPPALVRAWRDPTRRALVLWAAFVPALLSLPRGKLPTYVLSALVPLALIVGPEVVRVTPDDRRPFLWGLGATLFVALAAAAVGVLLLRTYPVPILGRLAVASLALAWLGVVATLLRRGRLTALPFAVLGVMLTLGPVGVRAIAPAIGAVHSERDAARLIAAAGPAPVILFGIHDPSLTFYLGAPVIYTGDPALVGDVAAGDGLAFVVTSPRHFAEIERALGERAYVWQETPRRRLYANQPRVRNGSR